MQNLRYAFRVLAKQPLFTAIVMVILGAVAFVACLVPARRATLVDPIQAIRTE